MSINTSKSKFRLRVIVPPSQTYIYIYICINFSFTLFSPHICITIISIMLNTNLTISFTKCYKLYIFNMSCYTPINAII